MSADIALEVLNPHAQISKDNLGDFCDSSIFNSHPLFSSDPLALQIGAYYDEVNPIGSYVKEAQVRLYVFPWQCQTSVSYHFQVTLSSCCCKIQGYSEVWY